MRQSGLTGDPSETSSWDGYLDDGGVDSRQFSFARGRSTICVYDDVSRSAIARKVVRTIAGRDRLRLSVAPIESHSDGLLVTATGYLGRIGDPTYYSGSAADQHVGTVIVTARPRGRPCPRRAPEESAFRTASADIDDARFSTQIAVPDAFDRSRPAGRLRIPDRRSARERRCTAPDGRPCQHPLLRPPGRGVRRLRA